MKKTFFLCMLILALLLTTAAAADPARFLKSDKNQAYHSEHLLQHLGSENCKVSGNYIKIRTMPGGNKVVGHLEKADVFSIDKLSQEKIFTIDYRNPDNPDKRLVSPVVTAVTSNATLCEIAKSDQLAWLFWVEETDMTEEAWDDFLLDGEWDWTLAGVRHDLDNEEYDPVDYSPFYRVFEPGKGDPLSSR